MTEQVLYAFTNRDGADSLRDIGKIIEDNGGPAGVNLVEVGNVAALVSPQAKWKLLRSTEHNHLVRLQHFQSVLETAMNLAPILPTRHQTVLSDREAVSTLLAQHGHTLVKPVRDFGGLIEFEVVIQWDINDIVRDILGKDGLNTPRHSSTNSDMARSLENAIAEKRRVLTDFIKQALKSLTVDMIDVRGSDQGVLCRMLVLLQAKKQDSLLALLKQIDDSGIGKLQMNCIGPLPPCSFASVEVWLSDVGKVEAARRQLALHPVVQKDDIRKAYHMALKTLHPDLNGGVTRSPDAAEKISRIRHSYELLSLIADGQTRSGLMTDSGSEGLKQSLVRLDGPSLEKTFLVSLRREGERMEQAA